LVIWKCGLRETFGGVKSVTDGFANEPCVLDNRRSLRRSEENGGEENEKVMCGRFQFFVRLILNHREK